MEQVLTLTDKILIDNHNIYYYVNKNDTCISQWLLNGNIWESFMIEYFKRYIKENSNIIDIGANIGTHSIILSKLFPNCKVIAFEPIIWQYNILNKNIKINNITNCIAYNNGLGSKNFKMYANPEVMEIEQHHNFGAYPLKEKKENDICHEVDIIPLDSYNFKNISFMKIDVETHEIEVLKGSLETIKLCKPIIIIEVDPNLVQLFIDFVNIYILPLGYTYKKISHCDYLFEI